MHWLNRLFSRRHRYAELSASIQEHLNEKIADLMDNGMSREEAERTARREFGNTTLIEQRGREQWQWQQLESLWMDLKHAIRRLRLAPAFTFTVILTLAIGIGANTAVFSVINRVLIQPLPYPQSQRLVALHLIAPGAPGLGDFRDELNLSASMYLTFSAHNRVFQSIGVWGPGTASITGIAKPEQIDVALVSDGVLQTFNVPAAIGQWLTAADQDPHGNQRVMLSYGYWQRRFGGDPNIVGRTIQVDNRPREIAGVMPQGFKVLNYNFDLLAPFAFDPTHQPLAGFAYRGVARLRPGVTIAQANDDIARLINVWMDSWTNGPGSNPHYYLIWKITPALLPLKDKVVGGVGNVLWVVMATIGMVMLIACTNVANLLLVRADARQQELAVRAALGAGRWRIARELLLESLTLGLFGGAIGIGVAYAGLRLLIAIGPQQMPRLSEITLDAYSLLFTLVLSVLSGLLFGSVPVLRYARARQSQPLGASRSVSASRSRQRGRNLLVIAQVAMALVLLICAVLMIRTFNAMRHVDPGFSDPRSLQIMRITIPDALAHDALAVLQMQANIQSKLASVPGVSSVGIAAGVPMTGAEPGWDEIFVEGKNAPGDDPPMRLYNYVAPGYFHTAGTRILAGRDFTWTDIYGLHPVGMVSESLAREIWGSPAAALGQHFREFNSSPWFEVIGVAEDVRENGVDQVSPPTVYWPMMMRGLYGPDVIGTRRTVYFAIRTPRAGTQAFLNEMQQAVWSVNRDLPLSRVSTMQEIYNQSMARTSFTLVMLAIAGSMAMALGILGIYGVISYAVAQRTREIGIRMALGANKSELAWMFVRSALVLTAVGAALGLGSAALLVRLMRTLLFGIHPLDPLTFTVVPAILVAAAALASYIPARRTASVDPVEALRAE